ncbi:MULTISPECIES: hypothetical protein [Pseudomonas]|uniref:hypothetical protein n=1 Tax=Pseudomonas TaxID=286 RepID=UPI001041DC5B|nr:MULTISPECIES: hypothetical protein [Pseudomonas]
MNDLKAPPQTLDRVATFTFDATTFVNAGDESKSGDWSNDRSLSDFPVRYPSLSHWGLLPLAMAWAGYSQDVHVVSWRPIKPGPRDESFLDYCCWRQTRGDWRWENELKKLAQANEWMKAGV